MGGKTWLQTRNELAREGLVSAIPEENLVRRLLVRAEGALRGFGWRRPSREAEVSSSLDETVDYEAVIGELSGLRGFRRGT